MTIKSQIKTPKDRIKRFCIKYHIKKLSFFGSILRTDFRKESDVDVLVEFEKGKNPGFLGLARIERELSIALERKVDLRTPQELSHYFRDEVMSSAEVQYAQK